ncbi:ion channel [Rhodalgimonas zhirmunskyi]|uniref:Potassium channel family protein n=1 Tax=Rhodalgimonas zhirmunskyi TaxID=2964767 RepID=A0AAJ1X3S8_9RHOB|nr:ion channel [Rhodoalgimonas zhirmunskyi]MDQ2092811.1 potassium channel family protein [Rhodoalgimonas zhirmunskyi]
MTGELVYQIMIGSLIVILSVLLSALVFLLLELMMERAHRWLIRPPHRAKLGLVLVVAVIGALGMITVSVWVWALAYLWFGVFSTLEESLYFSLVSFTTLGFGDIILPVQWRILSGMNAANGFLHIGMMSAVVLETMRQVRKNQLLGR